MSFINSIMALPQGRPNVGSYFVQKRLFLTKGLQNTFPCTVVLNADSAERMQLTKITGSGHPGAADRARRQHAAIPTHTASRQPALCRAHLKQSLLWKPTERDQRLAQMQKPRPRILWVNKQASRIDVGNAVPTGENGSNMRQTDRQTKTGPEQEHSLIHIPHLPGRRNWVSEPAEYVPCLILQNETENYI